jgi:hypothetical protein
LLEEGDIIDLAKRQEVVECIQEEEQVKIQIKVNSKVAFDGLDKLSMRFLRTIKKQFKKIWSFYMSFKQD